MDIVRNKVSTKHPQFGKMEASWERDYTEVSREELIALADRSVVIDLQAKARRVEDRKAFEAFGSEAFSVRDILDNRRQRKTEEEKLSDMLDKADPEKLKAALAAKGIVLE